MGNKIEPEGQKLPKIIDPREVLKAQAIINAATVEVPSPDHGWIDKISPEMAQKIVEAMAAIRKAAEFG